MIVIVIINKIPIMVIVFIIITKILKNDSIIIDILRNMCTNGFVTVANNLLDSKISKKTWQVKIYLSTLFIFQ